MKGSGFFCCTDRIQIRNRTSGHDVSADGGRVPDLFSGEPSKHFDDLESVHGILKGEVSLYHWPPVWLVWNQLYGNWQFLFLLAKHTNPNKSNRRSTVQYSDTSPFSIPWSVLRNLFSQLLLKGGTTRVTKWLKKIHPIFGNVAKISKLKLKV